MRHLAALLYLLCRHVLPPQVRHCHRRMLQQQGAHGIQAPRMALACCARCARWGAGHLGCLVSVAGLLLCALCLLCTLRVLAGEAQHGGEAAVHQGAHLRQHGGNGGALGCQSGRQQLAHAPAGQGMIGFE